MTSPSAKCKNKADSFCDICGMCALPRQRHNILLFVKRAYEAYSKVSLGDQDKKLAPHIVCHNCKEIFRDETKGKRKGLLFGVRIVWHEPKYHLADRYLCLVKTNVIGKKNGQNISCPSAL